MSIRANFLCFRCAAAIPCPHEQGIPPNVLICRVIKPRWRRKKAKTGRIFKNSLLDSLGCTPVVRHEKWEQLGRQVDLPGVKGGCRVAWLANRKRALLGSNPPRNSRPETHGDAAGAGQHARRRRLIIAWAAALHLASP
jgi:hypothetical protein